MTNLALQTPYDVSHRLVTKTLAGLSRARLLELAARTFVPPMPRDESTFGAWDALADLLREVGR